MKLVDLSMVREAKDYMEKFPKLLETIRQVRAALAPHSNDPTIKTLLTEAQDAEERLFNKRKFYEKQLSNI